MRRVLFILFFFAPIISFAQRCDNFEDGTSWVYYFKNWKYTNCISINSNPSIYYVPGGASYTVPSANTIDGSQFVVVEDNLFDSYYYNDVDFKNLGTLYDGYCLCFDFAVFNDDIPGNPPHHPRIYITDGTRVFYFEGFATVNDTDRTFARTCAPIFLNQQITGLPGNADGQWFAEPPTFSSITNFNTCLANVTKIFFNTDYTNSPHEVFGYDNVCLKNCNCDVNLDFDFTLQYNTDFAFPSIPNRYISVALNAYDPAVTYEYDWGDGSSTIGSIPNATHSYLTSGPKNFTISKINSEGTRICKSSKLEFCMPAVSKSPVSTGGLNVPANPICNVDFDFKYHYNTDPYFSIIPNNKADLVINSPHASTYTYNWGDGAVSSGSFTSSNHVYGFSSPIPSTFNVCIKEFNGNLDGNCTSETCISMCKPKLYTSIMRTTKQDYIIEQEIVDPIRIYPNPANNVVNMDILSDKKDFISYQISDLTGKNIYSSEIQELIVGSNPITFDLKNFTSGIYQIKVKVGNEIFYKKLFVNK